MVIGRMKKKKDVESLQDWELLKAMRELNSRPSKERRVELEEGAVGMQMFDRLARARGLELDLGRPMDDDELDTYLSFMRFFAQYSTGIFIKVKIGGEWYDKSLAEIPGENALRAVYQFMKSGKVPTRVREEYEVVEEEDDDG